MVWGFMENSRMYQALRDYDVLYQQMAPYQVDADRDEQRHDW